MAWIVDARGASNFLSSFQFCFFACSSNYAQLQFYSSVFCMLLSPKLRLLYLVICFVGTSVPYNFFCVQSFFRLGSTHFYNKLLSHVCDVRTGDKDKWDLVEVSCLFENTILVRAIFVWNCLENNLRSFCGVFIVNST